MLADEGPEVEHHELEGNGVDDVHGERHRRRFGEEVDDVQNRRHDRVDHEVEAQRAADPEAAGESALQRNHRPHRECEDDEEEWVGVRAGFDQKDGLGGVEGRVHRPAQDDRKARHLQRAVELAAPHVEESGQERGGGHAGIMGRM